MPLILASASPRRLALLRQARVEPDRIEAPDVDEAPRPAELPAFYARRLAGEKAAAVAARTADPTALILAADTVVACGRRILPKAETADEARFCLGLLSGRRHRVITAVCVVGAGRPPRVREVTTAVRFKRLSAAETDRYLDLGEWRGKAGGYAIQGAAERFVIAVQGSYSNVVGLPLHDTVNLLEGLGWRPAA